MATGGVPRMARGWRAESLRGGVWRQAVWGLVMGLCVGAVAGAPAAMQPSSSSSGDNGAGGEVGCERPITDVMWGFALSLLAIFVAVWNGTQHSEKGTLPKLITSLRFTLIGPVMALLEIIGYNYVPMVCHLHKMRNEEMTIARIWAMLNPLSKFPARFLTTCNIVMYVRKGEELDLINRSKIWENYSIVKDETEAMLVGEEPDAETKDQYEKKQLSSYGKVVLFWGEYFSLDHEQLRILPKYGQLKLLRANSGFAAIAIGIQAIGYTYGIIFRSVKDLRVTPVEVIGLVMNFLLLIGVILYGTSNPCARLLVIYMDKVREKKFVKALQSRQEQDFEVNYSGLLYHAFAHGSILFILLLCISIVLFFIVRLRRATSIMIVLPLIIFVVSLVVNLVFFFNIYFLDNVRFNALPTLFLWGSLLLNIVAYVWAVIVTFHYWKSEHFNTRLELIDLSQLIPFIG